MRNSTGKMKKANKVKNTPVLRKSRKDKRKEQRQMKRKGKATFYLQKFGKSSAGQLENDEEILSDDEVVYGVSESKKDKPKKDKLAELQKQQTKQRKRQLQSANKQEDKNIKQLEKQLKLNKRKGAGLPKAFVEDGLDFLLDVCEKKSFDDLGDESDNDGSDMDEDSNDQSDHDEEGGDMITNEGDEGSELTDGDDGSMDEEESGEDEDSEASKESPNVSDEDIDENSEEDTKEKEPIVKEDIYGRPIDSGGKPKSEGGRYIPPALRAKMLSESDEKKAERLRLEKQIKGSLNRLAESNMHGIVNQIEGLYMSNSRNTMNECMSHLYISSLIAPVLTPERLILEHCMLIAILHANVGNEVGATLLQTVVKKFHELYERTDLITEERKELDNYVVLICHLFTFKVVDSVLIFDILNELTESFKPKDIELILLTLKSVGFELRKEDPSFLKTLIHSIQAKSSKAKEEQDQSRVKFMLDILMAIKNNNMKKIPNFDPEHQQHLKKILKSFIRPGNSVNPLKIKLSDLLKADERGRWWIVGSAWTGNEEDRKQQVGGAAIAQKQYSQELLDLARKMRMNSDSRKNLFCAIMSSEDYIDAFEKIVKIDIRTQKDREVAFVILNCCIQEKKFNPFYPQVMMRFANFDRKYRMAIQFALWDRLKEIHSLEKTQIRNMAKFLSCLIREGTLSLASLKVIEFADIDKTVVLFMKAVLTELLLDEEEKVKSTFHAVAGFPKLKVLREGLILFMKHFLIKNNKNKDSDDFLELKGRVVLAEQTLNSGEKRFAL